MKNLILITTLLVVISWCFTSCIVDISKENCVLVKGQVEQIYEGGDFDVFFKLQNDNRRYYVNRGLENGLVLRELQDDLEGKEIAFWHAKTWVQDGGHITQLQVGEKILYSEWEN